MAAALAAYATGYLVGATIGGVLTVTAIPRYGWRSAFAIGGAMSLVLLLVAWRRPPEMADDTLTARGAKPSECAARKSLPTVSVLP